MKLGIIIAYYNNNEICEVLFKNLMENITKQLTDECILYIIEDGQNSIWLDKYKCNNIIITRNEKNKGLSYSHNRGIDYLINKCSYITFIDSDDNISDNYISEILKYCNNTNEIVKTKMIKINYNTDMSREDITTRVSVTGFAYRVDIIGDLRFKEHIRMGQDNIFYCNIKQEEKQQKLCDATYYYQFGINNKSIVMQEIENTKKVENKNMLCYTNFS